MDKKKLCCSQDNTQGMKTGMLEGWQGMTVDELVAPRETGVVVPMEPRGKGRTGVLQCP